MNSNNVTNQTPNETPAVQPASAPEVPAQPVEAPVAPAPVVTPEVPAASAQEQTPNVVTSGTATEAEIEIDASKSNVEVLDEYAINKDVEESKSKNKKSWTFIIIFFAILFIAIFAFKYIVKLLGY